MSEVTNEAEKPSEIRSPSPEIGLAAQKTLCTKWHVIVFFVVPLLALFEGLLPHSFGTFIANFRSLPDFDNVSLVKLDMVTTTVSALGLMLLPLFLPMVRKWPLYHQVYVLLSFLVLALSCFMSSLVPHVSLLFLTYTLPFGIGLALIAATFIQAIEDYFPVGHKHHVAATSLYQIGYPLASAMGNPFSAYIIGLHGWRVALRTIGGIECLAGLGLSFLIKPKDNPSIMPPCTAVNKPTPANPTLELHDIDANQEDTNPRKLHCTWHQLRSTPQLYPWVLAKYLNYAIWFALRTNITLYFTTVLKFDLQTAANLMTIYALSEIAFLLLGTFAMNDYFKGYFLHIHLVAAFALTLVLFLWNFVITSHTAAVVGVILVGFFIQASLTFGYTASVEVLGWEMAISWTTTQLLAGLGILSSPLLAGLVFDVQGSLAWMFPVLCVACLVQTLLYIATLVVLRKHKPYNVQGYQKCM